MTDRNAETATLRLNRRLLLGVVPAMLAGEVAAQTDESAGRRFGLPMGLPDRVPGDSCYIRHGYACENVGFSSGWWHTGENWYLSEGNSAGALVLVVAAGEVVYADADYPGRVVIIRHDDDLYSMYGHLDDSLAVGVGTIVELGDRIGTVLFRTDARSPSHLHFELRTFLTTDEVNGASPRYDYSCGAQCPPGPGYWPMSDPDHPSTLGWRNPMHVVARRSFPGGIPSWQQVVVASNSLASSTSIWSDPGDVPETVELDQMLLIPGQRFRLLDIAAGAEASIGTSAGAYSVWYEIDALDDVRGWVRAFEPSFETTGSDGRPAALRLNFLMEDGSG